MSEDLIALKSSDNEIVKTSLKCVLMCHTIGEMIRNLQDQIKNDKDLEIPVPVVDAVTLRRIVQWLEKWQDDPQPTLEEINNKTADSIDQWNQNFFNVLSLSELYDLINASNYLGIPGLLWLGTREVAYMIKGKTAEEIRSHFNIQNDWSPEELAQVQRENQWCEER